MIDGYVPFSNINSQYLYIQYYVCNKVCVQSFPYYGICDESRVWSICVQILRHCLTLVSLRISYDITEKMVDRQGKK